MSRLNGLRSVYRDAKSPRGAPNTQLRHDPDRVFFEQEAGVLEFRDRRLDAGCVPLEVWVAFFQREPGIPGCVACGPGLRERKI